MIEIYKKYFATIKLRRGDIWDVRPECEPWDGRRVLVRGCFRLDADSGRPEYDGEIACDVQHPNGWPAGWIASGDLIDIEPANIER